jgi:hypothetical protein
LRWQEQSIARPIGTGASLRAPDPRPQGGPLMANRMNWSKDRDRRLMGAKGIDPIGGAAVRPRAARKRPPTKAELRAQAEAAFRQWNSRGGRR